MQPVSLASASPDILAQVLALNTADQAVLSPLDAEGLARLVASAAQAVALVDGGRVAGFLIEHVEDSPYWGAHFAWFRARFGRFAYIDRVVVAPFARGTGLARRMYADLAAAAVAGGRDRLACEISRDPPNPGSEAFHARLGFAAVGHAEPPAKPAVYLVRDLAS